MYWTDSLRAMEDVFRFSDLPKAPYPNNVIQCASQNIYGLRWHNNQNEKRAISNVEDVTCVGTELTPGSDVWGVGKNWVF